MCGETENCQGGRRRGCHCDCSCSCGGKHHHFGPSFWSREEKITWLEQSLEDLQAEAKFIEQRIAALKGDN